MGSILVVIAPTLFSASPCSINRQILFAFQSSNPKESNWPILSFNNDSSLDRSQARIQMGWPIGQIPPLHWSTVAMSLGARGITHGCLQGALGRQTRTINVFSTVSPPNSFKIPNPLNSCYRGLPPATSFLLSWTDLHLSCTFLHDVSIHKPNPSEIVLTPCLFLPDQWFPPPPPKTGYLPPWSHPGLALTSNHSVSENTISDISSVTLTCLL